MENKKPANLTNYILILLLVAVAFLAGMYVKDTRSFDSAQDEQEGAGQGEAVKPEAAPEETVLVDADWQKISTGGAAEKGVKGAKVTIVEFSEYQCPYCQRYAQDTQGQIMKEYEGKIRYIFHDFPLAFHQNAQVAAEAARCAGDQGKYWEMHDALFAKHDEWSESTNAKTVLLSLAQGIGLDKTKFSSCLESGKFTQAVKDDLALGQAVGVTGTPSFFVNGRMLVGAQPFESFKAIIDEELSK